MSDLSHSVFLLRNPEGERSVVWWVCNNPDEANCAGRACKGNIKIFIKNQFIYSSDPIQPINRSGSLLSLEIHQVETFVLELFEV